MKAASFSFVFFLFLGLAARAQTVAKPDPLPAKPALPAATSAPQEIDDAWHFSLGLGYIINGSYATFSNVSETTGGSTYSGNADITYKPTYMIMLEGQKIATQSWGFMGGLNYEGQRDVDSGTVTIGGTPIALTGSNDPSKVQFTTLYGSAVYRWDRFYLPFGLNYSIVKYTAPSSWGGSSSATGGLGVQVGAGWKFQNKLELEAYSWATSMHLSGSNSSASVDYGDGYFGSVRVYLKYVF